MVHVNAYGQWRNQDFILGGLEIRGGEMMAHFKPGFGATARIFFLG